MKDSSKIVFFVQARVGSTRLPHKMTLPFYENLSILEILLNKLKKNFENTIYLVTSTNKENDILEDLAHKNNVFVFRGEEDNVLKRFIDAALFYDEKKIIRICADNPFLDVAELKRLIEAAEEKDIFDYISFSINGIPSIKTHFGFWAEYTTLETLQSIQNKTNEAIYKEHVTNFIYTNPSLYNIHYLMPNKNISGKENIRMTLDTQQDFDTLALMYQKLSDKYDTQWGIDEIISLLSSNSAYAKAMKEQIIKNQK